MVNWKTCKTHLCIALLSGLVSFEAAASTPTLSVSATPNPATPGAMTGVDVLIADISNLYTYQFSLSFDPSVMQVSAGSEGAFLSAGGGTFFGTGSFDNTAGTISYAFNTLTGAVPGVSGAGTLAHFDFNVISAGTSALSFSDTLFLDASSADIVVQVQDGVLQAVPEPASYLMLGLGLAGIAVMRRRAST